MSFIKLDKTQLVQLEYTLTKELLRSNRSGTYSCTTLNFCNTRKYHGLLVVPQPNIDNERHVLLSALDETIIQHDAEFNLGLHKYPGTYSPKGHKYVIDFEMDPIPMHTYRVGGVVLKKEIIFSSNDDRILVKYTLLDAHSPTVLRIKPYLAYRNYHSLSKANLYVDTKYSPVEHGIQVCMYEGYSSLFMQLSKPAEYVHVPDWYKNIEYIKEIERGYEGHEDLYVPGYFDVPIARNEQIIISVGTEQVKAKRLKYIFTAETKKRVPRNTFENCLANSAQQFIAQRGEKTCLIAGFPWYECRLRDTFISLPGITLVNKDFESFKRIIKPLVDSLKGPHFSHQGNHGCQTDYSTDTSLWFIWTLQQLKKYSSESSAGIWLEFGSAIQEILYGYRQNESPTTKFQENGLLYTHHSDVPLSWMNAVADGIPVTPRFGLQVETNALWFNAVMFAIELAGAAGDQKFLNDWKSITCQLGASFKATFWNKEKGYLADVVNENGQDWSIRPNMIFAASLPYSPVSEKIRQLIVELVKNTLLTSRGLRTLSPDDINYRSLYLGNETERSLAFHQGTVWPWLLGAYTDAWLKIYGKSGLYDVEMLYSGFQDTILEHAIGSISEVYDGDPPHRGAGSISMAWSVAEIIRMKAVIDQFRMEDMSR